MGVLNLIRSSFGGLLDARLATSLPTGALERVFGTALGLVGVKMLLGR